MPTETIFFKETSLIRIERWGVSSEYFLILNDEKISKTYNYNKKSNGQVFTIKSWIKRIIRNKSKKSDGYRDILRKLSGMTLTEYTPDLPVFEVKSANGNDYLYLNGEKIATCNTGDWQKRYGTIEKWLKKIRKREEKRINKINSIVQELEKEREERMDTLLSIMAKNGEV